MLGLALLLAVQQPHLRNDVVGSLAKFARVVAHQAHTFPQSFFLEGQSNDKVIALTFDDGPDPIYTDQILGILDKADVKATFFMVGAKMRHWPDVARRIEQRGHATGGHGYEHIDIAKLRP